MLEDSRTGLPTGHESLRFTGTFTDLYIQWLRSHDRTIRTPGERRRVPSLLGLRPWTLTHLNCEEEEKHPPSPLCTSEVFPFLGRWRSGLTVFPRSVGESAGVQEDKGGYIKGKRCTEIPTEVHLRPPPVVLA